MSDHTDSSKSRRSVLKIAGISLAGIIGGTGIGAAQTDQNQQVANENVQFAAAEASGDNSRANVNQRSEQNIAQNQQADNSDGKKAKRRRWARRALNYSAPRASWIVDENQVGTLRNVR